MRLTPIRAILCASLALPSLASCDSPGVEEPPVEPPAAAVVDSATMMALADHTRLWVEGALYLSTVNGRGSGPIDGIPTPQRIASGIDPTRCDLKIIGMETDSSWTSLTGAEVGADYGEGCVFLGVNGAAVGSASGSWRRVASLTPDYWSWHLVHDHVRYQCIQAADGSSCMREWDGEESLLKAPGLVTHYARYTYIERPIPGSWDRVGKTEFDLSSSYTPDSGLVVDLQRAPVPAGSYTVQADFRFSDTHFEGAIPGSYRVVVSTPTPWHWPGPTRPGMHDAGVLEGRLDGDPSRGFRFTWTGPETYSIELFGVDR